MQQPPPPGAPRPAAGMPPQPRPPAPMPGAPGARPPQPQQPGMPAQMQPRPPMPGGPQQQPPRPVGQPGAPRPGGPVPASGPVPGGQPRPGTPAGYQQPYMGQPGAPQQPGMPQQQQQQLRPVGGPQPGPYPGQPAQQQPQQLQQQQPGMMPQMPTAGPGYGQPQQPSGASPYQQYQQVPDQLQQQQQPSPISPPVPSAGSVPHAGSKSRRAYASQPAYSAGATDPYGGGGGMPQPGIPQPGIPQPGMPAQPGPGYDQQQYGAVGAATQPGYGQPAPQPGYGAVPQPGVPNGGGFMQPAQAPQFFTPGDPNAGQPGFGGQPQQPAAYGAQQPGYGAQPQQPAYGQQQPNVAALATGMAGMSVSTRQVPAVSLFNIPPFPQELDGPAGQSWLLSTSSVSQAPTANPTGAYCAATINSIPSTQAMLTKTKLPFGLVIAPYRKLLEGEPDVPVINPEMIVRCRRCRTYINPWIQFVEQGTRWRCNLCYLTNEVPGFFDWDAESRQRVDRMKRAELTHSVVEFVAPQEYMVRPPQPCVFFFVIDVSFQAVQSGAVAVAARTILDTLDRIPNSDNRTKIGFMTVDSTLHFYNLGANLSEPQMLVLPDLEEVFLPQPDDLLVNLTECRKQVEALLGKLGEMFRGTSNVGNALGTALQAAYKLLMPIGGKIVVLNSTLPNTGQGALKAREDPKLLGTSKETQLLQPAIPFYKTHAVDCSRAQISIDLFLFGGTYEDVATLSACSRYTAGACFFYPAFNAARSEDATKFGTEFSHFLSKPLGLEAVLRVRASKGIRMAAFHGNFFLRSTDLLALPNVNPDAAYGVECEIEETLQSPVVCFQTAVLHTSSNGERRIRVITSAYPVTTNLMEVFGSADGKAIAAFLAKKGVDRALTSKLEDARDALMNKSTDILGAYKQTFGGQQGQLTICENLKMTPLLTLGTVKNIAFRGGATVPSDVRAQMLGMLYMLPVEMVMAAINPKFYALHTLPPDAGLPHPETGFVVMPPLLNCSSERIERHGAYLLDNGLEIFLWLARGASPDLIAALFDRPYDAIQTGKATLPMLQNTFSQQVNGIIGKIRRTRLTMATIYPTLYVVKEDGDPALRMWFLSHMIEDRGDGTLSYAQYLTNLREQVAKIS